MCQSFSAAAGLQHLLPPVKTGIIRFTFLLGISQMKFGVRIEMLLLSLDLSLYQNVRRGLQLTIICWLINYSQGGKKSVNTKQFRTFKHQLFHTSFAVIHQPTGPVMTTPGLPSAPMEFFAASFTVCAHTLPTAKSKFYVQTSCRVGVLGKYNHHVIMSLEHYMTHMHDAMQAAVSRRLTILMMISRLIFAPVSSRNS